MRWLMPNGTYRWHPDNKYRIKWGRPAPSKGAQAVKDYLKRYYYNHVIYEEYRLPSTLLKVDFLDATKRWAIEFNGPQHTKFNQFFHGSKVGYINSIKRDLQKIKLLELNNYTVIELEEEDLTQLPAILT